MDKDLLDDVNTLRNVMANMSRCELRLLLNEYEYAVSKDTDISFEEYAAFISLFNEFIDY